MSNHSLQTREVLLEAGALRRLPALFRRHFGEQAAVVVADRNTLEAAGSAVIEALRSAGISASEPFVFTDPSLYAEYGYYEELQSALAGRAAVPVAVGSGTLNDLTKLAAHRLDRPYLAVATAASMDGYTAFGASITRNGSKQTFACSAPRAVLADLDVLRQAPAGMSATGYADLLAKVPAGADWLVADALGEEPVDTPAWHEVQGGLRAALADPDGVRRGDEHALRRLMGGLSASGTAMQLHQSSRPASGAEHQFSHLWDMQGHRHNGSSPAHGFKVGVATLAVTRLYEHLLGLPLEQLDVGRCVTEWPTFEQLESEIDGLFPIRELRDKALEETRAKWINPEMLRRRLDRLRGAWAELRERLEAQLLPSEEVRERLRSVGAPVEPEEIGITRERLAESFRLACFIRRRFTVLDLAVRTATLDHAVQALYGRPCV